MTGSPTLRHRLVETASALVRTAPDHPAGSVLRCYARAARLARLEGCSDEELPERARQLAESLLRARTDDRLPVPAVPFVPAQRHHLAVGRVLAARAS